MKDLFKHLEGREAVCFSDLDDTFFASISRIESVNRKAQKTILDKGITKGQFFLRSMLNDTYMIPVTARDFETFKRDLDTYKTMIDGEVLIDYGSIRLISEINENDELIFDVDAVYQKTIQSIFKKETGQTIEQALSTLNQELNDVFNNTNIRVTFKIECINGKTYPCYIKIQLAEYQGEQYCFYKFEQKATERLCSILNKNKLYSSCKIKMEEVKNGIVLLPYVCTKEFAVEQMLTALNEIAPDMPTISAANDKSDLAFALLTDYTILANEVKPKAKKWILETLDI